MEPCHVAHQGDVPAFSFESQAGQLIKVGLALSSTRVLGDLLEMVLLEARKLTGADAGSVYLVDGSVLRFETSQNGTLSERLGEDACRALFKTYELPLNAESIAGYVAVSKEMVNIADVYDIDPSAPYRFNPASDRANDYSTHSMLSLPMMDQKDEVVGVLQLINATRETPEGKRVVPFDSMCLPVVGALASQAAVAIVNAKLTMALQKSWLDSVLRLGLAAEYRDKETANHITRVSEYALLLGRNLGMDKNGLELLHWGAAMHDTGKLGIPDSILHKPGLLTPEERATMEYHTLIGALILKGDSNPILMASQSVALTHHERWDGNGYPRGLSGEAIPLFGRITALVDVFDALSSRRVYKPAFSMEKVVQILGEERGRHFDPTLVDILLDNLDEADAIRTTHADTEADFEKFRNYSLLKIEDVL